MLRFELQPAHAAEDRLHHALVLVRLDAARRVDDRAAGLHPLGGEDQQPRLQADRYSNSFGFSRQRTSGRRPSTPVLLHGTSTSAASNGPAGGSSFSGQQHRLDALDAEPLTERCHRFEALRRRCRRR